MATARQQQAQSGRRTTLRNSILLFFFCEPHVSAQSVVIHFNELNIFGFSYAERMLDGVSAVEHLVQMASHIMTQHIDVVHIFFFFFQFVQTGVYKRNARSNQSNGFSNPIRENGRHCTHTEFSPGIVAYRANNTINWRCHGNDEDPSHTKTTVDIVPNKGTTKEIFLSEQCNDKIDLISTISPAVPEKICLKRRIE